MTSLPSALRHRRCTDVRFPSSDRERQRDEPAWLSDMTPRRQRGSVSLHCCMAIVSRYLHKAGARHYAARVAEDCERRRRMTDELHDNDDDRWTTGLESVDNTGGQPTLTTVSDIAYDDTMSRHYNRTQSSDAPQTDDGKQRTLDTQQARTAFSSSSSSRSVTVRDSKSGRMKETRRKARKRSDSDSDSSHRPCIRDLRFRPRYPARVMQHWRSLPYSVQCTSRYHTTHDYEAWRNRRRTRRDTSTHDRRSTSRRSVVKRKSKTEKSDRYSVSSTRSSSSSASSVGNKSNSKDQHCSSKHSSADEHDDKTQCMKTAKEIFQTVTDNTDAGNLLGNTFAGTSPSIGETALAIDKANEHNSDDAKHRSSSHSEPTLDIGKTSDIGNEMSTDLSSTKVDRPCENCAASESGLKSPVWDTVWRPETPTTDNNEVNTIEGQGTSKHCHDSCSMKTPGEDDSECTGADSSKMSPSDKKHRHSRSGSAPRSTSNRRSVEATKSENNDSYSHDHQIESMTENREKRKRHHSGKRSHSRSYHRRKRRSSKHGVDHEHRTMSRYSRHEKRTHGRRQSPSSSRGRNSSSSSSDNDHCSPTKRHRKRESPNSGEDQLSDHHRLKAERKRLEKVQKKAERALQKLQQLELNYKENNLHRKKPCSPETTTTMAVIPDSQDKDLLRVNSNRCYWNSTEITSDKLGRDVSVNVLGVDFIASYTSPVSSPSTFSEAEPNSCDNPAELLLSTHLEQMSNELQCDETQRQVDLENNGVITCDSRDLATAVTPPSCIVSTLTRVSSVSTQEGSDEQFDNEVNNCDSTISKTVTTSDASQSAAVVDDGGLVQLDSADRQISVHITTR